MEARVLVGYLLMQLKMASSSSSSNSPCAACKYLRRKCIQGCIFAPYFPPEEPQKFVNVHKIFGASNVTKLLNKVLPHQREDAVNSLAYEAEARIKDPVYGCVGAISFLQSEVNRLQKELDATNADLIRHTYNEIPTMLSAQPRTYISPVVPRPRTVTRIESGGGSLFLNSGSLPPYPPSWTDDSSSSDINERGGNM